MGYAGRGPRYSESTLKKHEWVTTIYKDFAEYVKVDMWPITADCAAWFVRVLGLEVKYAISSIEDVIIPSLKRLNRDKTGQAVDSDVARAFSVALADVKRSKDSNRGSDGKPPAILRDIRKIIRKTPPGLKTKAAEASL